MSEKWQVGRSSTNSTIAKHLALSWTANGAGDFNGDTGGDIVSVI